MDQIPFLTVWTLGGVAVLVVGVNLWRYPERPRDFFRRFAPSIFGPKVGEKLGEKIYTTEGMRVTGVSWVVGGSLFAIVGVTTMIVLLVNG